MDATWWMENYNLTAGIDSFGLKGTGSCGKEGEGPKWVDPTTGDESWRGVPEGPPELWRKLTAAMRTGEVFYTKRLAWDPETRAIDSPRNSIREGMEFVVEDVEEVAFWLEQQLQTRTD